MIHNPVLFQTLIDRYNSFTVTHNYIYGFDYKGMIYMVMSDSSTIPYLLTLDKASRDGGYSLRFIPNNDKKIFLLLQGATPLCSKKFFDETVSNSKYNKGEIFEKMIFEHFGKSWKKNNIPFNQAEDIVVDDIGYQIKFEKATFTNEKILDNLTKSKN